MPSLGRPLQALEGACGLHETKYDGSLITSFPFTSFLCNIDEGGKSVPSGATVCVEFAHSLLVCVGLLPGTRVSSHGPKMNALGKQALYFVPVPVSPDVCLSVRPAMEQHLAQGRFRPCTWAARTGCGLRDPELIGKSLSYLFLLTLLKYICIAHVCINV